MQQMVDFEIIRMSLALVMFASSSYFDLKKRSVSDMLWVGFGAAAGIIYVFDFPSSYPQGVLTLTSIGLTAAISYGIYRLGFFGGADALALVTFSAILPLYDGSNGGFFGSAAVSLTFHPIAPLMVLTNAIILSVSQVILNLSRNVAYLSRHPGKLFEGLEHESTAKKIFATMVGYRSEKPQQYAFSIERSTNGRREFDFALKPAETTQYETRQGIWVTSAVPFLVYLTAGLIVMIFGGDIMAFICSLILLY